MRHEWQDESGWWWAVDTEGSWCRYPDEERWRPAGLLPSRAVAEMLRLAEENRTLRADLDGATITAEEGQEIIAELTAALAVLAGESLRLCAGGCPGHLGPKAAAAAREALERWTALEEENRALIAEVEQVGYERGR